MLGLRRAGATRYTVIAIILTTIAFLILLQAYHALYLGSRSDEFHLGSLGNVVLGGKPTKKPSKPVTLVVASVSATNTSWIQEYFPQHDHKIYIADDENAELTINLNKGRESAVYLTYVFDDPNDQLNETNRFADTSLTTMTICPKSVFSCTVEDINGTMKIHFTMVPLSSKSFNSIML